MRNRWPERWPDKVEPRRVRCASASLLYSSASLRCTYRVARLYNDGGGPLLDPIAQRYFEFHQERFRYLIAQIRGSGIQPARTLVIGPSFETAMIAQAYPESRVDTLGFFDARYPTPRGEHVENDFDSWPPGAPSLEPYDLIVAAEVIEHLRLSPAVFFSTVASWLSKPGVLILQTPNAASLAKRWRLLCGDNPYMLPPQPFDHTFHVREYTLLELTASASQAGLRVASATRSNYFRHAGRRGQIYRVICDCLPQALRDGITIGFTR